MNISRRNAVAALIAAGLLWGTTVPLSKLALQWLSPGWLTSVRFGLAAAVLLAAARRRGLRHAFTPAVLAAWLRPAQDHIGPLRSREVDRAGGCRDPESGHADPERGSPIDRSRGGLAQP